jgi:hypothetical protein
VKVADGTSLGTWRSLSSVDFVGGREHFRGFNRIVRRLNLSSSQRGFRDRSISQRARLNINDRLLQLESIGLFCAGLRYLGHVLGH